MEISVTLRRRVRSGEIYTVGVHLCPGKWGLVVRGYILVNIETTLRSHRYTRTRLLQLFRSDIRVDDGFLMLRGGNDCTPNDSR